MGQDSPPIPVPIAFLVCDQTAENKSSGKKVIVGPFDIILVSEFPTAYSPTTLYAKLTNCEGDYDFDVRFARVGAEDTLLGAKGTLTAEDRLRFCELVIECPPLPLPEAGEYEFTLWMNGCFIQRARIIAQQRMEEERA